MILAGNDITSIKITIADNVIQGGELITPTPMETETNEPVNIDPFFDGSTLIIICYVFEEDDVTVSHIDKTRQCLKQAFRHFRHVPMHLQVVVAVVAEGVEVGAWYIVVLHFIKIINLN